VRYALFGFLPLLAACAGSATRAQDDVDEFSAARIIQLYVTVREGERRRDAEYAGRALHYSCARDRARHESDLAYLKGVQAGPICAPRELHLVGVPPDGGPGHYLMLEPVGLVHRATPFDVVRTSRGARILYSPSLLTEQQKRELSATARAAVAAKHMRTRWEALEAEALSTEVDRLRVLLRYEIRATEYASSQSVPLAPFAPPPAELLQELEDRSPEEVRAYVVTLLNSVARP